jgi:tRNA-guanine family transglycosylase
MVLDELVAASIDPRDAGTRRNGAVGAVGATGAGVDAPVREDAVAAAVQVVTLTAQFGIIRGRRLALRTESVQATVDIGFEVRDWRPEGGEPVDVIRGRRLHRSQLPADRPRYSDGNGDAGRPCRVRRPGIDCSTACSDPNARNGQLPTRHGVLVIRTLLSEDRRPPIRTVAATCRHFSRAYLRHLSRPADDGGDPAPSITSTLP